LIKIDRSWEVRCVRLADIHEIFSRFFRAGDHSGAGLTEAHTPLQRFGRSTSPTNIRHFTEHGHRIYSEDLLTASTDPELLTKDEQGNPILDSRKFLADNLVYPAAHFNVVLCWNLADYLDESLVKPVVGRLWSVLKPGGMLLAFFHTRDAGPDSPCHRFHIVGADTLEMQKIELRREARRGPTGAVHTAISDGFQLQRVFNNRHIETLFRDFASIKFFLARDNVREVLVVR
jgi:SAM-dependent methyltransferase